MSKNPTYKSKDTLRPLPPPTPSEQEIRTRAYEIFLAKGSVSGNEEENWLEAERDLCARAGHEAKTNPGVPQPG